MTSVINEPLKIIIVGFGGIARRHLTNLREIEPHADVTILRHKSPGPAESVEGADRVIYALEEALQIGPHAALITGPASRHVQMALILAEKGIDLFIEKPISDCLQGVDELIGLCESKGLVLMVGYNFRFHKPFGLVEEALNNGVIGRTMTFRAEVGGYLPDWRPGRDYRSTVSARKELGGGAVLELSHELDYIRRLFGDMDSVYAKIGRQSDLELDVEDTAEIVVQSKSGIIGSIHLNMIEKPEIRVLKVVGTHGTLRYDLMTDEANAYSDQTNAWSEICPAGSADRNEMYTAELIRFLECVRTRQRPIVGGEEGKRALELAIAAKISSETGKSVSLK
jgi:predicted dehydrogenase